MKSRFLDFRLVAGAFLVCCALVAAWDQDQPNSGLPKLKIIHFDVGNGDATLLLLDTASAKKSMLIDGGNRSMAGKVVIPGIRQENLAVLDFIIATHYDPEHRDGLEEVLKAIPVSGDGAVYDRDRGWPSGKENSPLQPGSRLVLVDKDTKNTVIVECVATNGSTRDWRWNPVNRIHDENAQSLALRISFGKFRYFIGGDLTGGGRSGWNTAPDIESHVAKDVGEVDVLRVDNHGSATSTNAAFLAALNPTVAVISTGHDAMNDRLFHWPSREVLDRLNKFSHLSAVYITGDVDTPKGLTAEDKKKVKSAQGTVTISTTGQGSFEVNGTSFPLK
jgi:beta-lactamase superfamily II metal-dependent hydrolase